MNTAPAVPASSAVYLRAATRRIAVCTCRMGVPTRAAHAYPAGRISCARSVRIALNMPRPAEGAHV